MVDFIGFRTIQSIKDVFLILIFEKNYILGIYLKFWFVFSTNILIFFFWLKDI